jgi:nicotinamide riboside transporter PnuC
MEYLKVLEILATIITLIGIALISIPKRLGMYILIVGSILWIIFSYLNSHYFFLIQTIICLILDIYGIYSWKKKGIE